MWSTPPADLVLSDLDVWRADLDLAPDLTQRLRDVLAPEERARADRLRFAHDRRRWTVARGALRLLLGHYVGVVPAEVRLEHNAYGKPALDPWHRSAVCFNLAHSGGVALLAFAVARDVGVDVEAIRTDLAFADIADGVFSARERAAWRQLPAHHKVAGFFNAWTRKEAYIKARGMGLSLPLDQFDVSLVPGAPAMLEATPGEPAAVQRWSLRDLAVGPGYAAAVAAAGHDWQVRYWHFEAERWLAGR